MERLDRGAVIGETGTGRARRASARDVPGTREMDADCHLRLIRAGSLAEVRIAEILRPFSLSWPTLGVLMAIGRSGQPLSPCVISDRLVMPRNTLTHVVDGLERQGLVRRERHPHHRGMVLVDLTDAGRAILDQILPHLRILEDGLRSSFSEEEHQTLVSLLVRIEEAFAGKGRGCGRHAG